MFANLKAAQCLERPPLNSGLMKLLFARCCRHSIQTSPRCGATNAEIVRARAWAINFGSILLETGLVDMPRHAAMGLETLQRVANDFARY
jgi:hypothetical protein